MTLDLLWGRLLPERGDRAWMAAAACAEVDAEVFYPKGKAPSIYDEAKRICARCPVKAECLEWGLDEVHGCWGGLAPTERKRERKRRRTCPSCGRWKRVGGCACRQVA